MGAASLATQPWADPVAFASIVSIHRIEDGSHFVEAPVRQPLEGWLQQAEIEIVSDDGGKQRFSVQDDVSAP